MDLKQYLQILKNNSRIFFGVILAVVIAAFTYFFLRPESFTTSLILNITRNGSQETADYKFDDFYRLQADEKFAETVVEWLKSPRTASDIYTSAGFESGRLTLRQLSKSFRAEKLSAQVVSVSFSAADQDSAKKISRSIVSRISQSTAELDKDQKEKTWFTIAAHEPVIAKAGFDPAQVLFFSLIAGIFLAFWTVLIIYYLK
jgi:capsular polysaccharide biosynthesis protein